MSSLPERMDAAFRCLLDAKLTEVARAADLLSERMAAYLDGTWCGECRYGVVEHPPCCTQPTTRHANVVA